MCCNDACHRTHRPGAFSRKRTPFLRYPSYHRDKQSTRASTSHETFERAILTFPFWSCFACLLRRQITHTFPHPHRRRRQVQVRVGPACAVMMLAIERTDLGLSQGNAHRSCDIPLVTAINNTRALQRCMKHLHARISLLPFGHALFFCRVGRLSARSRSRNDDGDKSKCVLDLSFLLRPFCV